MPNGDERFRGAFFGKLLSCAAQAWEAGWEGPDNCYKGLGRLLDVLPFMLY